MIVVDEPNTYIPFVGGPFDGQYLSLSSGVSADAQLTVSSQIRTNLVDSRELILKSQDSTESSVYDLVDGSYRWAQ